MPERVTVKILIVDWAFEALKDTPYQHGQELEGTADDAFRIARELFDAGRNAMVLHSQDPNLIRLCVDTKAFGQR